MPNFDLVLDSDQNDHRLPHFFLCDLCTQYSVLIIDHFFHKYSAFGQRVALGRFIMVEMLLILGSFPFTVQYAKGQ